MFHRSIGDRAQLKGTNSVGLNLPIKYVYSTIKEALTTGFFANEDRLAATGHRSPVSDQHLMCDCWWVSFKEELTEMRIFAHN